MEMLETVWQIAFILGLVGFGVWFTVLTGRMSTMMHTVEDSGDQLEEIKASVELVGEILNRLPELMPNFTMNNNPLQPIMEAFASKIMGVEQLKTVEAPRGSDGRFNGTEETN